jgi:hypothetical protein
VNLKGLGGPDDDSLSPNKYHKGYTKRGYTSDPSNRPFIAWDGEGVNLAGAGKPQSYVLFGSSMGAIENTAGLSIFEILDHIIETGVRYPHAFHVGFAFNYDSNMILKGISAKKLKEIHETGGTYIGKRDGSRYRVSFTPGKFFRVTRYNTGYDRSTNPHAKETVTIEDIFSFFARSFIKAYTDMVGPVPAIIVSGKANRKSFNIEEIDDIRSYWEVEIQMLKELAEVLRQRVYEADLKISRWYGPGALASYAMQHNGVKRHMEAARDEVRRAAQFAYAGGRFELFKVGRYSQGIYSIDINSAYPYAITQLPSLTEGQWVYRSFSDGNPAQLARFGVYHCKVGVKAGFAKPPGPLFHRDFQHNISYPWINEGWYWTPEVMQALPLPGVEVVEGWEYVGWETQPFAYMEEMFNTRRDWKRVGNRAEIALKLCMNSHYGKMAQRVGWDPKTGRIPPWHQLEWAGWVTSHTRSILFDVMKRIPWDSLIAVETDGLFMLTDPAELGICDSKELGGWEVTTYDELLYVQSGLAWLRKGDEWKDKRRGLDADSFTLESARGYLSGLSRERWEPFVGKTTRFIGLGAALNSRAPTGVRHCVWQATDRAINPGSSGKRVHLPSECQACREGKSAYESAHDLVIRSLAGIGKGGQLGTVMSHPHYIPWEQNLGDPEWRKENTIDVVGVAG